MHTFIKMPAHAVLSADVFPPDAPPSGGVHQLTPNPPNPQVDYDQLKSCSSIFSAIGDHVMVTDERYLDMSTAIAGSGPYYLFLTMETMVDAGVHMGLPREMSERLVKQTLYGSCMYAMRSQKAISALRNGAAPHVKG